MNEAMLSAAITRFLQNGGTVDRAHALVDHAAERLPGKGQNLDASNGHRMAAQPRQAVSGDDGASRVLPQGHEGRAPSPESDAAPVAGDEAIRCLPQGHGTGASSPIDPDDDREVIVVHPTRNEDGRFLPKGEATMIRPRTARQKERALAVKADLVESTLGSVFDRQLGGFGRRIGLINRRIAREGARRFKLDGFVCDLLETEVPWPDDETPLERFADEAMIKGLFRRAFEKHGALHAA